MSEKLILEHITDDERITVTRSWCMCGGCEDLITQITDLKTNETVSMSTFSYPEFEKGYEQSNLSYVVEQLAIEVARLRTELAEKEPHAPQQ